MPTQTTFSTVHVAITQDEFVQYLTANLASFIPADAALRNPNGPGARSRPAKPGVIDVAWTLTIDDLDPFLRTVINDLPEKGSYNVRATPEATDGTVAVITWQA